MKDLIERLPDKVRHLIHVVSKVGQSQHLRVYLVGGLVRDLLLGVDNLDLDIVVEGDGIKFAKDFCKEVNGKLVEHPRFGTASVMLPEHLKVDFSSARKEIYPAAGHLPEVSPGDIKEDLFRRDFTVNAMAVSISKGDFGRLVDFFGGKVDLKQKRIRIMHESSFLDDPTRILRAVRFEQRLGFSIEPGTLKLLKEAARLKMIGLVQPHRLRDDLILVLKEKYPVREIRRMQELCGFSFLDSGIKLSKTSFDLLSAAEKEIDDFRKKHPHRRHLDSWLVYLMCIFDSLDHKTVKFICRKFAFRSGEEKRMLSFTMLNRRVIESLSRKTIKPSKVFALLDPFSYEVILLIKAKYKNPVLSANIDNFLERLHDMRIHISGEDLKKLGAFPGPEYQRLLSQALDAKLDGKLFTKNDELGFIKKILKG